MQQRQPLRHHQQLTTAIVNIIITSTPAVINRFFKRRRRWSTELGLLFIFLFGVGVRRQQLAAPFKAVPVSDHTTWACWKQQKWFCLRNDGHALYIRLLFADKNLHSQDWHWLDPKVCVSSFFFFVSVFVRKQFPCFQISSLPSSNDPSNPSLENKLNTRWRTVFLICWHRKRRRLARHTLNPFLKVTKGQTAFIIQKPFFVLCLEF